MALMLGALSILTFWMFGLGIVLGAAAIGTALAARRPDTPGHDPGDSSAGLVGILAGIAGIAFGVVFLTTTPPVDTPNSSFSIARSPRNPFLGCYPASATMPD